MRLVTKKSYCLLMCKKRAPSRSAKGPVRHWVSTNVDPSEMQTSCRVVVIRSPPARAHQWDARRGRRRDARSLSRRHPRRVLRARA